MPSICEDAFRYPTADVMARLIREFRTTIAALCVVHEFYQHCHCRGRLPQWPQVGVEALQVCFHAAACRRRHGEGFLDGALGCRGCAGADDRCDGVVIAPECGLLHRTAHERPLEAPCLLCLTIARGSRGELMPSICEDAFRFPATDIIAKLSHQFRLMTNQVLGYLTGASCGTSELPGDRSGLGRLLLPHPGRPSFLFGDSVCVSGCGKKKSVLLLSCSSWRCRTHLQIRRHTQFAGHDVAWLSLCTLCVLMAVCCA